MLLGTFVFVLPLVVTGTTSFEEAGTICEERAIKLFQEHPDYDFRAYWTGDVENGGDIENVAWTLLPVHFFNSASAAISVASGVVYISDRNHQSMNAATADLLRTCVFLAQLFLFSPSLFSPSLSPRSHVFSSASSRVFKSYVVAQPSAVVSC